MTDAITKLNRIHDAMLDDIMKLTPEELRQEFIEDGEDPDKIVAEQRAMIAKLLARSPAVSSEPLDNSNVADEK